MLKQNRLVLLSFLTLLFAGACSTLDKIASVPYTIDHGVHGAGELSGVNLENGDKLVITIINTDRDCFFYNVRDVRDPSINILEGTRAKISTVTLEVIHDEANSAYDVEVFANDALATDPECAKLKPKKWTIPVRPRWNLAGSGGFAGHTLTNPVFFLAPSERDKDDPSTPNVTEKESGFIVRRNKDAEDAHSIAGAAFVTLYQSGRGFRGVNWAPLSFGLAVDQTRNDYLLGTSFRFGNRAYLTVGRIFGSVARLRDGVVVDQTFTTDANFLASPPSRRDDAWFFGIHYSFIDQGISNLFKNKVGIPVPAAPKPPTNPAPATTSFTLILDKSSVKPGDTITITPPTGKEFGGRDADVSIKFGENVTLSTAPSLEWGPKKIVMKVPAIPPGPTVGITILKKHTDGTSVTIGTATLEVKAATP